MAQRSAAALDRLDDVAAEYADAADIWAAYADVHLLMPDGSMKLGGEAVAEVLRLGPATRWLARSFSAPPVLVARHLCHGGGAA